MFKDRVSQLSLSPSSTTQLAHYARAVRKERSARALAVLAILGVLVLQVAILTAPPTPANGASLNDLIYGGAINKQDLIVAYDSSSSLQALYGYFGISRPQLDDSQPSTLGHANRFNYVVGRLAYFANDTPVTVGSATYFARKFSAIYPQPQPVSAASAKILLLPPSPRGPMAVLLASGDLMVNKIPAQQPVPPATATNTSDLNDNNTPSVTCSSLKASLSSGPAPLRETFSGTTATTKDNVKGYSFNFGDGQQLSTTSATASHVYAVPGSYSVTLQPIGASLQTQSAGQACRLNLSVLAPPVSKRTSVIDLTQNKASGFIARPGDLVRYTLLTTNASTVAASVAVTDNLSYVLQYAQPIDVSGAQIHADIISWPSVPLAAGKTVTRIFTVRVKSPIPAVPEGLSDPLSYNLAMNNVYGNASRIDVQPPTSKLIERSSANLPEPGNTLSIVVLGLTALLVVFFYARNRQLELECKRLLHDFSGGL